jgi:hypothetical protein
VTDRGLSDGPTPVVSTSHFGGQAPGTAWSRYVPANVHCLPSNHSIHILEEAQSILCWVLPRKVPPDEEFSLAHCWTALHRTVNALTIQREVHSALGVRTRIWYDMTCGSSPVLQHSWISFTSTFHISEFGSFCQPVSQMLIPDPRRSRSLAQL